MKISVDQFKVLFSAVSIARHEAGEYADGCFDMNPILIDGIWSYAEHMPTRFDYKGTYVQLYGPAQGKIYLNDIVAKPEILAVHTPEVMERIYKVQQLDLVYRKLYSTFLNYCNNVEIYADRHGKSTRIYILNFYSNLDTDCNNVDLMLCGTYTKSSEKTDLFIEMNKVDFVYNEPICWST